jgi:farnesyl-diphosphate farnesyltransferase
MVDFDLLLTQTSRTFALAVPLLPAPLREQVGLAYLLFRVADTLEDAERWTPDRRIVALRAVREAQSSSGAAERLSRTWSGDPPVTHAGYLELLKALPDLTRAIAELPEAAGRLIRSHWQRTVCRMITFLERADHHGAVRLADLSDLRRYCYAVAGIVGEMLTELFPHHVPSLEVVATSLRSLAPSFGEGLQLVNILKDARADAAENKYYLPSGVPASAIMGVARDDLRSARQYVELLREHQAPPGVLGFAAMPVMLAEAALDQIERRGPGARIPRSDVARIGDHLMRALSGNAPLWLNNLGGVS